MNAAPAASWDRRIAAAREIAGRSLDYAVMTKLGSHPVQVPARLYEEIGRRMTRTELGVLGILRQAHRARKRPVRASYKELGRLCGAGRSATGEAIRRLKRDGLITVIPQYLDCPSYESGPTSYKKQQTRSVYVLTEGSWLPPFRLDFRQRIAAAARRKAGKPARKWPVDNRKSRARTLGVRISATNTPSPSVRERGFNPDSPLQGKKLSFVPASQVQKCADKSARTPDTAPRGPTCVPPGPADTDEGEFRANLAALGFTSFERILPDTPEGDS